MNHLNTRTHSPFMYSSCESSSALMGIHIRMMECICSFYKRNKGNTPFGTFYSRVRLISVFIFHHNFHANANNFPTLLWWWWQNAKRKEGTKWNGKTIFFARKIVHSTWFDRKSFPEPILSILHALHSLVFFSSISHKISIKLVNLLLAI